MLQPQNGLHPNVKQAVELTANHPLFLEVVSFAWHLTKTTSRDLDANTPIGDFTTFDFKLPESETTYRHFVDETAWNKAVVELEKVGVIKSDSEAGSFSLTRLGACAIKMCLPKDELGQSFSLVGERFKDYRNHTLGTADNKALTIFRASAAKVFMHYAKASIDQNQEEN